MSEPHSKHKRVASRSPPSAITTKRSRSDFTAINANDRNRPSGGLRLTSASSAPDRQRINELRTANRSTDVHIGQAQAGSSPRDGLEASNRVFTGAAGSDNTTIQNSAADAAMRPTDGTSVLHSRPSVVEMAVSNSDALSPVKQDQTSIEQLLEQFASRIVEATMASIAVGDADKRIARNEGEKKRNDTIGKEFCYFVEKRKKYSDSAREDREKYRTRLDEIGQANSSDVVSPLAAAVTRAAKESADAINHAVTKIEATVNEQGARSGQSENVNAEERQKRQALERRMYDLEQSTTAKVESSAQKQMDLFHSKLASITQPISRTEEQSRLLNERIIGIEAAIADLKRGQALEDLKKRILDLETENSALRSRTSVLETAKQTATTSSYAVETNPDVSRTNHPPTPSVQTHQNGVGSVTQTDIDQTVETVRGLQRTVQMLSVHVDSHQDRLDKTTTESMVTRIVGEVKLMVPEIARAESSISQQRAQMDNKLTGLDKKYDDLERDVLILRGKLAKVEDDAEFKINAIDEKRTKLEKELESTADQVKDVNCKVSECRDKGIEAEGDIIFLQETMTKVYKQLGEALPQLGRVQKTSHEW